MYRLTRRPFCLLALALILFLLIWHRAGPPGQGRNAFEAVDRQRLQVLGTVVQRTRRTDGFTYELDHITFYPQDADLSYLFSNQNPNGQTELNPAMQRDPVQPEAVQAAVLPSHRLLLRCAQSLSLHIGQRLIVRGECRVPERAANPGQFDAWFYYRARNIVCTMQAEGAEKQNAVQHIVGTVRAPVPWLREQLAVLRVRMWEGMERVFGADAAILEAALLGERSGLDSDVAQLFRNGGIACVLSASALPVTLLAAALYRLLRRMRCSFALSAVVAAAVVLCSAELAGSAPGAQRAAILFLFWLGAQVLGRVNDRLNALGAAALFILLRQPFMLYDVSFLLSFACILSLEVLPPAVRVLVTPGRGRIGGHIRRSLQQDAQKSTLLLFIWERFLAAFSIQLGILPITLWFFYRITPYGIALSLLVLPCMSLLLGLGLIGAAAGACALSLPVIAAPVRTMVFLLVQACRLEERLPGAVFVTGRPHPVQIAGYYLVLALLVLFSKRKRKCRDYKKRPVARSAAERMRKRILPCLRPLLFIPLFLLLTIRIRPAFCCTFLDVGQGGCCLVEQGRTALLFDAGSSSVSDVWEGRIAPALACYGIRTLDAVFLSHSDSDHVNGIAQYLQEQEHAQACGLPAPGQVRIRQLFLPEYASMEETIQTDVFYSAQQEEKGTEGGTLTERESTSCTMQELADRALASGIAVQAVSEGMAVQAKDMTLQLLGPSKSRLTGEANQDGIVLYLSWRDMDILLTGDLEKEGEERFVRAYAENDLFRRSGRKLVLAVGHHGSKYATSKELLQLLRPDLAVISCGKRNRYGHPAQEVLTRLREAGVPWKRTDTDGAVQIAG